MSLFRFKNLENVRLEARIGLVASQVSEMCQTCPQTGLFLWDPRFHEKSEKSCPCDLNVSPGVDIGAPWCRKGGQNGAQGLRIIANAVIFRAVLILDLRAAGVVDASLLAGPGIDLDTRGTPAVGNHSWY